MTRKKEHLTHAEELQRIKLSEKVRNALAKSKDQAPPELTEALCYIESSRPETATVVAERLLTGGCSHVDVSIAHAKHVMGSYAPGTAYVSLEKGNHWGQTSGPSEKFWFFVQPKEARKLAHALLLIADHEDDENPFDYGP